MQAVEHPAAAVELGGVERRRTVGGRRRRGGWWRRIRAGEDDVRLDEAGQLGMYTGSGPSGRMRSGTSTGGKAPSQRCARTFSSATAGCPPAAREAAARRSSTDIVSGTTGPRSAGSGQPSGWRKNEWSESTGYAWSKMRSVSSSARGPGRDSRLRSARSTSSSAARSSRAAVANSRTTGSAVSSGDRGGAADAVEKNGRSSRTSGTPSASATDAGRGPGLPHAGRIERHRHSLDPERGSDAPELSQAAALWRVRGDRRWWRPRRVSSTKPTRLPVPTCTNTRHARGVQRAEELAEPHRLDQVADRELADRVGVVRVRRAGGRRPQRDARRRAASGPVRRRTGRGSRSNSGEWKPERNGSSWHSDAARGRGARARSSTWPRRPHRTLWCGQLSCETATSVEARRGGLGAPSAPQPSGGEAPRRGPRGVPGGSAAHEARRRRPGGTISLATIAVHSPMLWPAITSGRTPSSRPARSVRSRPSANTPTPRRSSSRGERRARRRLARRAAAGARTARRRRRRWGANVGSTPGKRNASVPPSCARPARREPDVLAPRHGCAAIDHLAGASARRSGVGSSEREPHRAVAVVRAASGAVEPARASPSTGRGEREPDRRRASARGRVERRRAAPRRERRRCRRGASSTTWALMPPKPNALTPARRGRRVPRLRAPQDAEAGRRRAPGCGSSQCRVGGSTPWWTASAALIRPAAPAAGIAWPIIDFTEPSAARARRRSAAPKTARERGELGRVAGRGGGAVRLDQADAWPGSSPAAAPGRARARAPGRRRRGVIEARRRGRRSPRRCRGSPRRSRSPSRSASASRLSTTMPDALADQDAVGAAVERTDLLARATARRAGENTLQNVTSWQWCTPPASTTSRAPLDELAARRGRPRSASSRRPRRRCTPAPRRSSRLAMREAARLGTRPIAVSGP